MADTLTSGNFVWAEIKASGVGLLETSHIFYHTYLRDIPYLKKIEIPITFAETGLCGEYKDVTLQITATCERPTTRSEVYQYAVKYDSTAGSTTVLYDKLRGAENSSAMISLISWKPPAQAANSEYDCSRCGVAGAASAEGYNSGYGGGVGGGAVDGAGGGSGKAIASVEVRFSQH